MNMFPAIADYAFLSDCENSCLIAPDGSVEWLCLPRPDSPSIFGAILDRSAGYFRLGPSTPKCPTSVATYRHDGARDDLACAHRMAHRGDLLVVRPVEEATDARTICGTGDVAATGPCCEWRAASTGPSMSWQLPTALRVRADAGRLAYDGDSYHQMSITCAAGRPASLVHPAPRHHGGEATAAPL